jgi:hypothetical protein
MSINLLKTIQENESYPELQKIDPNVQHEQGNNVVQDISFSQVAITAVLAGLYKYSQSDEGASQLLNSETNTWADKIFDADKIAAVQRVADYSKVSYDEADSTMNAIANNAVNLVRENMGSNNDIKDVKSFMKTQSTDILLYLPPELNMGQILHDNTLDDNTNKMEGPISSLIKNIGNAFSNPVTDEEINNKQQ